MWFRFLVVCCTLWSLVSAQCDKLETDALKARCQAVKVCLGEVVARFAIDPNGLPDYFDVVKHVPYCVSM